MLSDSFVLPKRNNSRIFGRIFLPEAIFNHIFCVELTHKKGNPTIP